MAKNFFITGTDTDVGKTVATALLGLQLQQAGHRVMVFKPVQCGGDDAEFLKNILCLNESMEMICPYFAEEPCSPHLALPKSGIIFDKSQIIAMVREAQTRYDYILIEGAGGVMVPITEDYWMMDLMRDLAMPIVLVSRNRLGTINHTLLSLRMMQNQGLDVAGVIFNQPDNDHEAGFVEATNADAIRQLADVPFWGEMPHFLSLSRESLIAFLRKQSLLLTESESILTKNIQQMDRDYVWHPFTQMLDWNQSEPLVIEKGDGIYLYDSDGQAYVDGVSSLWVNVHGHRHPWIDQAMKKQIDRLSHSTFLGLSHVPAVELAHQLVHISPEGLQKVFYSDNGSTAVEIGLKMAYQYWQNIGRERKIKIAHLSHSYHGDTLGSVSVGGIDLFHKVYQHLIFETLEVTFPDGYRCPDDQSYPEYFEFCLDQMELLFKEHHEQIACLVAEPIVQGAAGMIVWPEGVLKRMVAICRKYDILFVADEVATGFGRTGQMFACQHEAVIPDILCVAKGLTGGYLPLAATITTQKIFDAFCFPYKDMKTFFHGHTYTGNPVCSAAALANLEVFEKENTLAALQPKIAILQKHLAELGQLDYVGDIRQKGFMVGIELVFDVQTKEPFPWEWKIGVQVCDHLRKMGIILRPLGNVIVIMPPLSITEAQIVDLMNKVSKAIKKVLPQIVVGMQCEGVF